MVMHRWDEVLFAQSTSNAPIKNTASAEYREGLYPAFSATGQDVWLPTHRYEGRGIVVSAVGVRCGKSFKADGKWNVVANTHALYVNEDIALRDYCWYALNNEEWWIKAGSGQPFVKLKDSLKRKHCFPPIEEQKQIVKVLDEVAQLISLRKEQLAKLDQLVKSRFIELFEGRNYPVFRLGDVCCKITDGTHKTPTYLDSGVTFISAKNIVNGELDFSDVKYISNQEYTEIQRRCQTEEGDILLSKSGSLGSPAIIKTTERIGLFESLAVIKYDRNRILAAFLCEQLKSDKIQRQFKTGTKGVAIKHLHLGVIADTNIVVPPIEEQGAFAAFVEQTDKSKLAIQQSLDKLELLKKSLMQEYFG